MQRLKFAEAVAASRTAYLWVREAAERAAEDARDAPSFVRMARGIVERAAHPANGLDNVEIVIARQDAFAAGQEACRVVQVGVARLNAPEMDLYGWFNAADGALYAAKKAGRNRVVKAAV